MFVTFDSGNPAENPSKRTKSTLRACDSCRKRKVRCDGKQPCAACQWQGKAARCAYESQMAGKPITTPRRRPFPERRQQQSVLQSLFPGASADHLASLSRDELVELLKSGADNSGAEGAGVDSQEDEANLEELQPLPGASADRSEASSEAQETGITDDVNALSLSVKHSTSYLGISSVIAVLRVIHWLDPQSKVFRDPGPRSTPLSEASPQPPSAKSLSMWDEVPAINAYFQYIQPFLPLLDEDVFRDAYVRRERKDDRWNLLLNCVLAMGSVVLHDANDRTHLIFFERVKQYLTLDMFGNAHIEILQAMAILTGTYLHYVQQPNLANFLMGAISRMATTLGLHRDYTESMRRSEPVSALPSIELRRRLWWCLLIMDSWNSNFLGRPTMGRIGPGHTTHVPVQPTNGSVLTTSLLQANIEFCKLSTKFENLLAERPILSKRNREDLDSCFAAWLDTDVIRAGLPNESPGVVCAASTSRWRGHTARIFLHRPVLLWYAMRKSTWSRISEDKAEAITKCRRNAHLLISDIQSTWHVPQPCQMAGWCATWLLYQATMVPLLSLFTDCGSPEVAQQASSDVEMALMTLRDLERWSPTAKRSYEVVRRLFEQSRAYRPEIDTAQATDSLPTLDTPSTTESANMQDGFFFHDFIGDLSWDGEHGMGDMGTAPSFLDYWDVGQEANRFI